MYVYEKKPYVVLSMSAKLSVGSSQIQIREMGSFNKKWNATLETLHNTVRQTNMLSGKTAFCYPVFVFLS